MAPRTFRNHFEHFDERLEQWATKSGRKNFVDMNIIPRKAVKGTDMNDWMRNLDPMTMTLTFRDDSNEIPIIEAALRELLECAGKKERELH